MNDLPLFLIGLVCLASTFSFGAGIKAAWHNCQLRRGGQRPLGMYSNIRKKGEANERR